jgi:hypothetical protein
MSLDNASVYTEQIPAFFYLGEPVLHWVCTDMSPKPNLKILKVDWEEDT